MVDTNTQLKNYQIVISLLYDIGLTLREDDDARKVFKSVLNIMSKHMGMHRGMITILNRKTGEISIEESFGLTESEASRGTYALGEGITGKVVESGNAIIVPQVTHEPEFLDKTKARKNSEFKDVAFICVPIMGSDGVIGTLSADKLLGSDVSLEEDQKLLTIIATMIYRAVRLHQAITEENQLLKEENDRLHLELRGMLKPVNMIGTSSAMQILFNQVKRISTTSSTVLILGESGVGKELVAQAIHYNSDRAHKPLVKFNCGALPENLIESELFGYNRGAFTGAIQTYKGKFEQAAGGTLFLDEVGEMSPNAQTKFLRVLQEKEIERVGGAEVIKVDVRVIAATNKDLEKLVAEGLFREDLYYRLNVFPILVPPLRDRKSDIIPLADHFIEKHSKLVGNTIKRISTPAIDMLTSYHWPGNVRELENCIERAVILADDGVLHGHDLPPSLQKAESSIGCENGRTLEEKVDALEYELIIEELKKTRGHISKAAANLGLSVRKMGIRIEKYSIDITRYKR